MKRTSYVDSGGNTIDYAFESKKNILRFFFIFGTIIPLILIGFIIYTAVQNSRCNNVYKHIKTATYNYLNETDSLPTIEGENEKISISKLYNNDYLNSADTNNIKCTGNIKATKYKDEYIYTLDLKNCNSCTTSTRYKGWSNELNYYPKSKSNVDVIPYYNYYERQLNTTEWTNYFEPEEISKKTSEYGVKLPEDIDKMPEIPEGSNIADVQIEEEYQYRYKDKSWLWYDITGDYSGYSSERPEGYANRDDDSEIYTKWSKYSQNYPEEKDYRDIISTTGYIFYYEKDGKKVYANHKNYTAAEDIDTEKYDQKEETTAKMYRYRDKVWRWYNGQKREYSRYYSAKPENYNYKDEETETEGDYSSWDFKSKLNSESIGYRTEETRIVTRYRYIYEILSAPVFDTPVSKEEFVNSVNTTVPEFAEQQDFKLEVSYKFRYQKR